MFELTFELEGLEEFEHAWFGAKWSLTRDLESVAQAAAELGIKAAQEQHPYTDRTYQLTETARAVPAGAGESAMTWPKDYASHVNKGTSRSKAYPFTPIAEAAAEAKLEHDSEHAADTFARRVESG